MERERQGGRGRDLRVQPIRCLREGALTNNKNECDEICVDEQQKTSVKECVVTFTFSSITQNDSQQMNIFGIYYLLGSLVWHLAMVAWYLALGARK